jgi:hypothetical protein
MQKHVLFVGGFLACASLVTSPCRVWAQSHNPSVTFGRHSVHLGQSAKEVIAELAGEYSSRRSALNPDQEWVVFRKNSEEIPVASLFVRGDSIVGVDHLVNDQEIESADSMFEALYAASGAAQRQQRTGCQLAITSSYDPEPPALAKATVNVSCGPYSFRVMRNSFKGVNGNQVTGYMIWEFIGTLYQ